MHSLKAKFKFFKRGFKETLVLIPGWATDYRLFSELKLNYNYILPLEFNPFSFLEELAGFLEKTLKEEIVSLFGYSLGGFLAADFAKKYPDRLNQLILLSIRKNYEAGQLKEIQKKIEENKKAWLYKFYLNCFSKSDVEDLSWFKANLLKDYLDNIKLEDLIIGLDYLSQAKIAPEGLSGLKKIKVFHGSDDLIAPWQEAKAIASKVLQAKFVCLRGSGHLLFLSKEFSQNFNAG